MVPQNKVSVILTSYNHAKYIREAIDSVLSQTFSDFELIIWDDHSIDNSWEIIQEYSDPRIKSFRNEEQKRGIWGINKAIKDVARSGYIAIHHSDDVWESKKLEEQMAYLDSNPEVGAVFTWASIINEAGEAFEDKEHPYYSVFDRMNQSRYEWLNFFFYHGNALCHPSVLIRKQCFDDCGLYRNGISQFGDFDMWVRLCLKYEIHILPEKLVKFRVRDNNANVSGDRPDAHIRARFEFYQILNTYRSINEVNDFIKVFPEAKKYRISNNVHLDFALAMLAIESEVAYPENPIRLFGLNILFDLINNPEKSRVIHEAYDFQAIDFIGLQTRYDIFSIETVRVLSARSQSLEQELHEIKISKSWRLVKILRGVRIFLFPPDSWRSRMVAKIFALMIKPLVFRQK